MAHSNVSKYSSLVRRQTSSGKLVGWLDGGLVGLVMGGAGTRKLNNNQKWVRPLVHACVGLKKFQNFSHLFENIPEPERIFVRPSF